ncbi:ROK family protein [Hafnia alvei]|uniref:ROK family protein n=1 Tax=Hafnia alvei TaxID=569 RepID=UPI001040C11A|nr:ROK family protein [Hafnia alvei]QBJ32192.1 ROK family protein [Hafnia alvei]
MFDLGLNNQRVRHLNKRILLALIYRYKHASKSMLAQHTGLSIPAIGKILEELLDEGKIEHSDRMLSNRGLSGGSYQIPAGNALILCMNVTPNCIESQLVNSQILPLGEYQFTAVSAPHPQDLLTAIEQIYYQQRKLYPQRTIQLALAIHGQVDPVTGVSQNMPQAPWKEHVEMKYLLEEKLKTRVLLDNDCVMLALAEKWQNTDNQQDFCVINVDYGIGSSFVINQQIYRGSLYGSGQIGHTIVNPDGVACDCGRYGCLETVASLSALKKRARIWLKSQPHNSIQTDWDSLSSKQLIERYHQGDVQVQSWVDSAASAIGLSLYNFLNILNINRIYFYGRSCGFGDRWLSAIMRQTGFNPFDPADPNMTNATRIGFGQLTRPQQIMGIGYLYAEKALEGV